MRYLYINGYKHYVAKAQKEARCVYCNGVIHRGEEKVYCGHAKGGHQYYHPECLLKAIKDFDWLINHFHKTEVIRRYYYSPFEVAEELGWEYPVKHNIEFLQGLLALIPYRVKAHRDSGKLYYRFWFFYEDVERFKAQGWTIEDVIEIGKQNPHPLVFKPSYSAYIKRDFDPEIKILLQLWKRMNLLEPKREGELVSVRG